MGRHRGAGPDARVNSNAGSAVLPGGSPPWTLTTASAPDSAFGTRPRTVRVGTWPSLVAPDLP